MTDLILTPIKGTDKVEVEGNTEEGIWFIDEFPVVDEVRDSGHIIIAGKAVESFKEAAEKANMSMERNNDA